MSLNSDLKRYRKQLIARAKKHGLYENFGQTEVMKLTDKHIDSSCYNPAMNMNRDIIDEFADWCRCFDDRQLNAEVLN